MEPLTPNHLLLLRPARAPPGLFTVEDKSTRKRWRQVQYLADLFWKRWQREYLPLLRQRTKWLLQQRDVAVGDVVLIIDYGQPRDKWLLGRVVTVHRGQDGLVRSAELRTKEGVCVRPVVKMCMLERDRDDDMEGRPRDATTRTLQSTARKTDEHE